MVGEELAYRTPEHVLGVAGLGGSCAGAGGEGVELEEPAPERRYSCSQYRSVFSFVMWLDVGEGGAGGGESGAGGGGAKIILGAG